MLIADIEAAAKSPAWDFKKIAAGGVTAARKDARKIANANKKAKKKKVAKRFKRFEDKIKNDRKKWLGVK